MLDALNGTRVFSVAKGHGSFLTINFECITTGRSMVNTSLWVYLCNWCIQRYGATLIDASNVSAETDFGYLIGSKFEGYDFSPTDNTFCLRFSDSINIQIVPDLSNYDIDDDMLMLTFTEGKTYGYSPGKGWQTD